MTSSEETIESLKVAFAERVALEINGDNENKACVVDLLESLLMQEAWQNAVSPLLDTLNVNQSLALQLRLGLNGFQPHSLREMARRLGISIGRSHRIKNKALYKLIKLLEI